MTAHFVPKALKRIDDDPDGRTCTIHYLRRELGRLDYGDTRIVTYLQDLVDDAGFPAPLPCAVKGKRGLTRAVTLGSRWIRAAVDAWLDDFTPPDLGATIDGKAKLVAASEMDAAAGHLQLVDQRGVA